MNALAVHANRKWNMDPENNKIFRWYLVGFVACNLCSLSVKLLEQGFELFVFMRAGVALVLGVCFSVIPFYRILNRKEIGIGTFRYHPEESDEARLLALVLVVFLGFFISLYFLWS